MSLAILMPMTPPKRPTIAGENNVSSKLTMAAVADIRAGGTYRELMDRYGVCKETVRLVRRRIRWAHVP